MFVLRSVCDRDADTNASTARCSAPESEHGVTGTSHNVVRALAFGGKADSNANRGDGRDATRRVPRSKRTSSSSIIFNRTISVSLCFAFSETKQKCHAIGCWHPGSEGHELKLTPSPHVTHDRGALSNQRGPCSPCNLTVDVQELLLE